MATEALKPTSIISKSTELIGFVSTIDEPWGSFDGSGMQYQSFESGLVAAVSVRLGMEDTAIRDIDTVNSVTIKVRAYSLNFASADDEEVRVTLWIDGNSIGVAPTQLLSGVANFQNMSFTLGAWDQDWTQAQLDSMQVNVSIRGDRFNSWSCFIDTVSVDVDYTELPGIEKDPDEDTLALTGKVPTINRLVDPSAGSQTLAGKSATLSWPITIGGKDTATLQGQTPYVNPPSSVVLPDGGSLATGWQGFISNVDELLRQPDGSLGNGDGSIIYYDLLSTDFVTIETGDPALINFASFPGGITDLSEIHRTNVLIRARTFPIENYQLWTRATFRVTLFVDGVSQGYVDTNYVTHSNLYRNWELNLSAWDQDWTVAQLNSMQVEIRFVDAYARDQFFNLLPVRLSVDTLNLEIVYTGQAPREIPIDGPATLNLDPKDVTAFHERFVAPSVETIAFSGKDVTRKQTFTAFPDPDVLNLVGKIPRDLQDHIPRPDTDQLNLTGKAPTLDSGSYPDVVDPGLDLAGKTPDIDRTDNHSMVVDTGSLQLVPEKPAADRTEAQTRSPAKTTYTLAGEIPVADRSENRWIDVTEKSLALSGETPFLGRDIPQTPTAYGAVLTGNIPASVYNHITLPTVETLSYTSYIPNQNVGEGELTLTMHAPIVAYVVEPGADALSLTGIVPLADINDVPIQTQLGSLSLAGSAPSLTVSSQLDKGSDSRFISLTVDYRIEHIGFASDYVL